MRVPVFSILVSLLAAPPTPAQCDATIVGDWISGPGPQAYPGDLILDGDLAFYAQGGRLYVLDVADPASIQQIGVHESPSTYSGGLALSDDLVYLASEMTSGRRGVQIIDVSDPASPALAGELDLDIPQSIPDEYVDLEVAGGKLLALDITKGLLAFDLADLLDPAFMPTNSGANSEQGLFDVWVGDDLAIMGATDTDLQIFDTGVPGDLPLIGEAESDLFFFPDVQQISVRRGIAYISGSNKNAGVHAFDISDPTAPRFLYALDLGEDTSSLVFRADVAIVSRDRDPSGVSDPASIMAVDLTDPLNPVVLSRGGSTFHVYFRKKGDLLFAVDQGGGQDRLVVYDVSAPCLPCSEADLAPPRGVHDFSDVVAFLGAFAGGLTEADLATPYRMWDFSDVVAYLNVFSAGCP